MRVHALLLCLAAVLLGCSLPAPAQETTPRTGSPSGDIFSGMIVSFDAGQITVNRRGLGKDSAVTRTFTINPQTKIEGTLKPKAHVTVRFMAGENAGHAVHIIVR